MFKLVIVILVAHPGKALGEIVEAERDGTEGEDKDTIVVVLEPSVVELFFEGGVVEVGVSGGSSFTGKSLEIHL